MNESLTNDFNWNKAEEIKNSATPMADKTLLSPSIDNLVDSYIQSSDDYIRLAKRSCKKCYGRGLITFQKPKEEEKKIACDCVVRNLRKLL